LVPTVICLIYVSVGQYPVAYESLDGINFQSEPHLCRVAVGSRALMAPVPTAAPPAAPFAARDPEQWLTPDQAKDELVCGVDYVWTLCRERRLKHRRNGRRILIKRAHIDEYNEAQVIGGGS
jgi:excisionase family DNA binding protein